jgi:hypothetical protein
MKFPPGRAFQRKRYERLKAVARDLMADDLRRALGTHRDRWNGWDDSPAARRRPRWPGSGIAHLAACLAHPPYVLSGLIPTSTSATQASMRVNVPSE